MNLSLFFLLIITADAINRLQMFQNHHNGRVGQRRNAQEIRTRHTKSTRYNKRRMDKMIRNEVVNRMCNIKTCTKCNKLVNVNPELGSKYCDHILRLPNCCSKEHMLYAQF